MRINNKNYKTNGGAAMMIVVLFFVFISLTILIGIITPVVREFKIAGSTLASSKAYFVAESGGEDAFYRIKNGKQISSTENLTIGTDTVTTTITNIGSTQKLINSLGDSNKNQRKVSLLLGIGDGVTFKYGTQAGEGGIIFNNNSFLKGNLYSNGNIVGSNNAYITGTAFVAGSTGSISNMRIGYGGTGDAHAHTVTDSTITGNLYCQTGSGNNKSCDTSQTYPTPLDLPISNDDITNWKNDAAGGTILNGDQTISSPTTLGLTKIVGNLTINSTLTITNTIWVTGNIIANNTIKLASSYGSNSGIIIADGVISTSNGVIFQNSGTAGSYIMILSTSNCDASMSASPCNGKDAISIKNNGDVIIANAQNGTISFANNTSVKESVGNKLHLSNNVGISYGTGVSNVGFTSGPSGSWNVDSWKESQ